MYPLAGLSIAFAVAERLLESSALTLFVTHYPQVTAMAQMYPSAKNIHMRTTINLAPDAERGSETGGGRSAASTPATGMKYLHEVSSGPCDMKSGYGLVMAEQSGFPPAVLDDARALRSVVRDKFPVLLQQPGTADRSLSATSTLLQHLLLLKGAALEPAAMQAYLQGLRDRVPHSAAEEMVRWLKTLDGPMEQHQEESNRAAKAARLSTASSELAL